MDAEHDSLNTMSRYFASLGVTAFVATTVTAPVAKIRAALKQVAVSKRHGVDGAEILGAYLEDLISPRRIAARTRRHGLEIYRSKSWSSGFLIVMTSSSPSLWLQKKTGQSMRFVT